MTPNPIPQILRSDHLFLLVGGNPLPVWVVARLLLNPGGQIHLVHTAEMASVAGRLSELFIGRGYKLPDRIEVDKSDAGTVFACIRKKTKNIRDGQVGLDYTGGTAVMSVHSYRALEQSLSQGIKNPIFSYLDIHDARLRFDSGQGPFPVALVDDCRLSLSELIRLHGDYLSGPQKQTTQAESLRNTLVDAHRLYGGFKAWRDWRSKLKNGNRFKKQKELAAVPLPGHPLLRNVAEILAGGQSPSGLKLGDIFPYWDFRSLDELAEWLDGKWLEQHVLATIQQLSKSLPLSDWTYGLETKSSQRTVGFEADVVGLMGYLLVTISCYSGDNRSSAKHKLFEAYLRARQLGGDSARVALMCCVDNLVSVNLGHEVQEAWDAQGKLKVFGRQHLSKLDEHLEQWFNQIIQ